MGPESICQPNPCPRSIFSMTGGERVVYIRLNLNSTLENRVA